MASKRITEASSGGTADGTQLWIPGAKSGSYKFTLQDLHNGGWIYDPQPWMYASATTFTIAGLDVAYRFPKGTRIRLKQGGAYKYFVAWQSVYSGGNTTVTIAGGTDYTLANAGITDMQYSYAANPEGYPRSFAYTPSWGSDGSQPSLGNGTSTGRFLVVGSLVFVSLRLVAGSTSTFGTGIYYLSLPIDFADMINGTAWVYNNAAQEWIGTSRSGLTNSNIIAQVQTNSSGLVYWGATNPFTFGNADECRIAANYEIGGV